MAFLARAFVIGCSLAASAATAQLRGAVPRVPTVPRTIPPIIPLPPIISPHPFPLPLPPPPRGPDLLPLPRGPHGFAPPPPPPLIPPPTASLWLALRPAGCFVNGVWMQRPTCQVISQVRLIAALRDPARRRGTLFQLGWRMAVGQVRLRFANGQDLAAKLQTVQRIYTALQAQFARVLTHIEATLVAAPADAGVRRAYAIADSAQVEEVRRGIAVETARGRAEAIGDVREAPERRSVELPGPGLAYRQAVAASLGRNVFDTH